MIVMYGQVATCPYKNGRVVDCDVRNGRVDDFGVGNRHACSLLESVEPFPTETPISKNANQQCEIENQTV